MPDLSLLVADLEAEHAALDGRVAALDDARWHAATPAEGWTVLDSVSHVAYFDDTARLALTDPGAFAAHAAALHADVPEPGGASTSGASTSGASSSGDPDTTPPDVALGRGLGPTGLLARWRRSRAELVAAVAGSDPRARVPWYGPPMGVASFVTARIMETWAHGQDVADGLGLPPVSSARLRHVCHIGVGARAYTFMVHGVADTGDSVRVEATAPDGELWAWGPPDAPDRIAGPALDLALVFTQRRHPADTAVVAAGTTATAWLAIAQSFAGPAGPGRAPLGVD